MGKDEFSEHRTPWFSTKLSYAKDLLEGAKIETRIAKDRIEINEILERLKNLLQ